MIFFLEKVVKLKKNGEICMKSVLLIDNYYCNMANRYLLGFDVGSSSVKA